MGEDLNGIKMNSKIENIQEYCETSQLDITFDVQKMAAEIDDLNLKGFEYYDVIPLRSPAHLVDPNLPFPESVGDFADGSWTEWLDTSLLTNSPYLTEVVNYFKQYTKVNLVRLLRLAPGAIVQEHTDPTLGLEQEKAMIRLTIPIQVNEGVSFWLNNKKLALNPGECWYIRLTDPHKVENLGGSERINLTIDLLPNQWVYDQMKME